MKCYWPRRDIIWTWTSPLGNWTYKVSFYPQAFLVLCVRRYEAVSNMGRQSVPDSINHSNQNGTHPASHTADCTDRVTLNDVTLMVKAYSHGAMCDSFFLITTNELYGVYDSRLIYTVLDRDRDHVQWVYIWMVIWSVFIPREVTEVIQVQWSASVWWWTEWTLQTYNIAHAY